MATATTAGPDTGASPDGLGRFIDPRGQRFGAGISVLALGIGYLAGQPLVVAALAAALAVSAIYGTRYSVLGRPWPLVRAALRIGPPAEVEHEYPPRFAQALGAIGLGAATVLFIAGLAPWGWLFAAGVGALQAVLAATGYCLGCRLYFLRWWVPDRFARLARRTTLA